MVLTYATMIKKNFAMTVRPRFILKVLRSVEHPHLFRKGRHNLTYIPVRAENCYKRMG